MKLKNLVKPIVGIMLMIAILGFVVPTVGAKASVSTLTGAVKKSVGKTYPLGASDKKTSSRMVCGAVASDFSSYEWYEKEADRKSGEQYILFVGTVKKKAKAKTAKADIKSYIDETASSMNSYLSADGKKLFKAAQVGYKGDTVWAVMVSTSSSVNKKAVKAIKKKM